MKTKWTFSCLFLPALLAAPLAAWGDDDHDHEEPHHKESLRAGHVDVLVLYDIPEGLHLALAAGEHGHGHEEGEPDHGDDHGHGDDHDNDHDHDHLSLAEAELVAGPAARQAAPEGPEWAFLGAAGRFVYLLPQAEQERLPFVGINTEELDGSTFLQSPEMRLTGLSGPGHFFLYQVDAFGSPQLYMDSSGDALDAYQPSVGTHVHMNWAFTEPGEYALTFELSATLADGTPVTSEPQVLHVHVTGHPTYLHEGHVDLQVTYEADHGLAFQFASDEPHHDQGEDGHEEESHDDADHGEDHEHASGMHPYDAVLLLGGPALYAVPDEPALAFLGTTGSTVYRISQQEMEGVPFLGWNTEELETALFSSPVTIELHHAEGPGTVFLYEVDAFGSGSVLWNSADPGEDELILDLGIHRHLHMAVTEAGHYTLELEAHADLVGGEEVHGSTVLMLQAGGTEGYYRHFHYPYPDWLETETGWKYVSYWPWVWNPEEAWLYASGSGVPGHLYYREASGNWIWTAPDIHPATYDFAVPGWRVWGQ